VSNDDDDNDVEEKYVCKITATHWRTWTLHTQSKSSAKKFVHALYKKADNIYMYFNTL
jgi:hypothetical protein